MIVDKITNLKRYDYVPNIDKAVEFLKNNDVKNIENGKYDLGDDCRVVVSEYETKEVPDKVVFECHRDYIDIQMVVSGEEAMYTQSIDDGEEEIPYDAKRDAEFFTASWYNTLCLYDGNFAVLFPNDLHAPSLAIENSEKVKKLVFKLKI